MFGRKRRESEQRFYELGRLPPGQALTLKFPVLHYGPVIRYNHLGDWTFHVSGLVEEEKTWTWEAFNQLPRRKMVLDLHCVTGWSKFDTEWEGVSVRDLVDQDIIKIKPEAQYCIQHCDRNYTTNLSLDAVLAENFLMATHYDDEPLDPEHGYPLRGLMGALPGQKTDTDRYLWKGGKWLRGLEFTNADRAGFWENNGYSMTGNVWREERYRRGRW